MPISLRDSESCLTEGAHLVGEVCLHSWAWKCSTVRITTANMQVSKRRWGLLFKEVLDSLDIEGCRLTLGSLRGRRLSPLPTWDLCSLQGDGNGQKPFATICKKLWRFTPLPMHPPLRTSCWQRALSMSIGCKLLRLVLVCRCVRACPAVRALGGGVLGGSEGFGRFILFICPKGREERQGQCHFTGTG